MKKLIEDFKGARELLIQAIKDFPEDKRDENLFDEWNLKDLLSHMSGWMISVADNVEHIKESKVPPWVKNIDDFNEKIVEDRKEWNWDMVYEELVETSKKFIEEYESLPENLWQKRYWSERSFTPKKILEIEIKHWKITHLPQITKHKSF